MELKGRTKLEGIVAMLDLAMATVLAIGESNPFLGSPEEWSTNAKCLDLNDEETSKQPLSFLVAIINLLSGSFVTTSELLFGKNIFTPALLYEGLFFWRRIPVTSREKKTIEFAHAKWRSCIESVAIKPISEEESNKMSSIDRQEHLAITAASLKRIYDGTQEFANDLRKLLG